MRLHHLRLGGITDIMWSEWRLEANDFCMAQACRIALVTHDLKPMIFWRLITIRIRLFASLAFLVAAR